MGALLSPVPVMRFYDNNNNPLAGGQLFTYQAGTTTPVATYTDSTASTANTNPIILNARGEAPVWLLPAQAYKFVLEDANGNTIWTCDQITSPAPVAVGNMHDELGSGGAPGFAANVDFTPGTTTTLTLSQGYGASANIWVAFDGAEQGPDSYSLNGATLTFTAPIPVGVNKVFVKGGTTLSIGTPGAGSVTTASLAPGSQLYNRVFDIKSAKDYGAKGDGVTDDTAALNTFFAALQNGGFGFLPDGTYNISNGFIINKPITLKGSQNAILNNLNSSLTIPIIHLEPGATRYTTLEGFTIKSVAIGGSPACAGIQVDAGQQYILRDLTIAGTQRGIFVEGASAGAIIDGCFVSGTSNDGYTVVDGNLVLSDCYAVNCTGTGFNFLTSTGSAGITMTNCTSFNSQGRNFSFQGSSGAAMIDVFLTNCVSSASPFGDGYYFDTYGKNILVTGCYCEVAGGTDTGTPVSAAAGFQFTPNNHRVTLTGCQSTFSGGPGVVMDCSYFSISGGDFTANGIMSFGSYPGVQVATSSPVQSFAINGINTIPKAVADVNSQSYGISFGVAGSSNGAITGCALSGLSGSLNIPSFSSVTVSANAGFVNEASGVATIPNGSNSVSVTHGMSVTPSVVILTIINGSGPTSLEVVAGPTNSSGFTIFLSTTAGASGVNVAWYARQ
jgi:hypothetical protein